MADLDQINLFVYRDLSTRVRGEPNDIGPLSNEAQKLRKDALHDDLKSSYYYVNDWGNTDDVDPHELVELIITIVSNPAVQAAAGTAAVFLASAIGEAVKPIIGDAIRDLWNKLTDRQEKRSASDLREVSTFEIQAPAHEGTVNVQSMNDGRVMITFEPKKPPD